VSEKSSLGCDLKKEVLILLHEMKVLALIDLKIWFHGPNIMMKLRPVARIGNMKNAHSM
jgi:hypothetical protein